MAARIRAAGSAICPSQQASDRDAAVDGIAIAPISAHAFTAAVRQGYRAITSPPVLRR
ncbi:MAG: hypothetical protein HOQ36_08590 [Nocardia sp.]|nr:hypothetical protein [Nocardia sp.]